MTHELFVIDDFQWIVGHHNFLPIPLRLLLTPALGESPGNARQ
jgi:hypothetical protein